MASYNLLQQQHFGFQSPAKVFAKLKSKVQKEATLSKEGVFTRNDTLFNVREQHRGAGFYYPIKKTANNELKGNQRFGSSHNEAQALTLSPISSPQKPCGYFRKPLEETSLITDARRGRAFMESTAVSQPPPVMVIRDQIRNSNGFIVSSRTPIKMQPIENCGRSVFEKKDVPTDSASGFSPMSSRLRKRKLDQRESNTFIRATEERRNTASTQGYTQGYTHNTCKQDLGHGRGFLADQSEISRDGTMLPQSAFFVNKHCSVLLERITEMSPAKMFASMKEKENKKQRREVCKSSRRELFDEENVHNSRDTPVPPAHSLTETEDTTLKTTPDTTGVVTQDSADRQSDIDDSEDTLIPAAPSQPILLEDPLVLNSPQILIPKKDKGTFRRNHWPQQQKFPVESVIYLKKWFLRRNQKGLFVDGIHGEDNIPWNSNIIVERVSNLVLKTVSGRVYILVGKMRMNLASDFPKSFLKKFVSGFPPNWNTLYEKFLSESKQSGTKNSNKVKPEASSINRSEKRQTQNPSNTPASCSAASSSSSTQVTRSGRMIKPPLEYWKGGRVLLDAQMNVTIHECYDNSNSEISTITSQRSSKEPVRVFLPSSEGLKQSESVKDEEKSVPVRKFRALRNRNTAEKPPNLSESTCEVLKVPEQCFGRTTMSTQRHLQMAMGRRTYVVSEKPTDSEKSSTQRSVNQTNNTNRPILRSARRTFASSSESSTDADQSLSHFSSDDEFPNKIEPGMKGVEVSNKSQSDHKASSSWPSESIESRKEWRNGGGRTKKRDEEPKRNERRCTKTSSHEPAQLNKRRYTKKSNSVVPEDEDKWTEAELMKLEEAVSYYPKHLTGYWAKVALMVGTRSAEECHRQHTSQGTSQSPKRTEKHTKKKVEAPKLPVSERPVISARLGTLKRKQQVRQFLEALPKDNVDDAFSSTYMQNKRLEIPSMCPSEEQDFELSELEPQTPMSSRFSEVKTPQCLHISPGMIGSPNTNHDDKYVYRLQRRMKKNQFNVCKTSLSSKRYTLTPTGKRTVQRCGNTENDTFFIREMFPANDGELPDSGEEEDFYFSDD